MGNADDGCDDAEKKAKRERADKEVAKVLKIIRYVKARQETLKQPFYFTFEQPLQGKLKHQPIIKEILEGELGGKRGMMSFCLFGSDVKKDTLVWTSSRTMYETFRLGINWLCKPSRKCKCTALGGKHREVRGRSLEAMPFPKELCKRWVECVSRDIWAQ